MRKYKKQVKGIVDVSMLSAGGALALGAVGGAHAVHGQQALANMSGFLAPTGRIMGASAMMRVMDSIDHKKKRR